MEANKYDVEAQALQRSLADHDAVDTVTIDTDRRPHRVLAELNTPDTPQGVQDIITHQNAEIEAASVSSATEGIMLRITPDAPWKPAGQRTVRSHGGSIVTTLSRQAIEVSDLAEDTPVDLEAREGQVRITRREVDD